MWTAEPKDRAMHFSYRCIYVYLLGEQVTQDDPTNPRVKESVPCIGAYSTNHT